MATQLFKLGLGFFIAAPKAVLTALGTPYVLTLFTKEKESGVKKKPANENIAFQGKNKLSSGIGKILDKKSFQNFVKKHKDSNFPMHIVAATDSIATATFVQQAATSKKLEKKDKMPLIYNSIIATGLSISSYFFLSTVSSVIFLTESTANLTVETVPTTARINIIMPIGKASLFLPLLLVFSFIMFPPLT
jgi:hypothetical protein